MPRKKFNSRFLRQFAEELVEQLAQEFDIHDREDITTSLVRQWITYDGHSTLFLRDQQLYFKLGNTPSGKPALAYEPNNPAWIKWLKEDWKLSPDDLPDIFHQLNCGQSAEVVNGDGGALRLWVEPKEGRKGVERLGENPVPVVSKNDYYRRVAVHELEQHLGIDMDADEMDQLACSLAKQWQQYEGHASLFIEGDEQFVFTLTHTDGGCNVNATKKKVCIESLLSTFGFASDVLPDVISRINLGQEIGFQDKNGIACLLWHDPRERRICVKPIMPDQPSLWGGEFSI